MMMTWAKLAVELDWMISVSFGAGMDRNCKESGILVNRDYYINRQHPPSACSEWLMLSSWCFVDSYRGNNDPYSGG
jgi:hypothetical protein